MNLPQGSEPKQSQWAWKIWLLFCQLTAERSETFSETMVNLTIDFAVGEVSANFQHVAILC